MQYDEPLSVIFSYTSHGADYKSYREVCKQWQRIIDETYPHQKTRFVDHIMTAITRLKDHKLDPDTISRCIQYSKKYNQKTRVKSFYESFVKGYMINIEFLKDSDWWYINERINTTNVGLINAHNVPLQFILKNISWHWNIGELSTRKDIFEIMPYMSQKQKNYLSFSKAIYYGDLTSAIKLTYDKDIGMYQMILMSRPDMTLEIALKHPRIISWKALSMNRNITWEMMVARPDLRWNATFAANPSIGIKYFHEYPMGLPVNHVTINGIVPGKICWNHDIMNYNPSITHEDIVDNWDWALKLSTIIQYNSLKDDYDNVIARINYIL
jgi:uncharacterized protein (DUF433 family)